MREPRRHLDFTQETLGTDFCGDLRPQNFYSDGPLVTQVTGEVYHSHSAFAELTVDGVAA